MSDSLQEKRVLALKYRPHRFEDLVGQSTVSQTLSLALDSNRLSHAYLFSGLRGSGKTSTARIMAKALLCSEGPTSKPCEVCNNCVSANANRHLDIIEMDAASNRGIDDIKDLIEHTKYKPSSARFKVFIIDEVHMLTTQAFNALLKTLEEPPGFVKFILATTDPLKLPATILSRTQHFRFNKIANSDVIHHLSHILNEENIDYETPALEILSRSGQGSLRDTLTLLDQAIIFSKGKVTTPAVVDMLGLIDPEMMDNIFNIVLSKGDIVPIIKELENYEVSQVCDEMTIYLKQKMLDKDAKFDLLLFDRFFRIISDAKHLLAINSDGGFVLILTLMKMIEATNVKTIDEIINQVQKIEVKEEISPIIQNVVIPNVAAPVSTPAETQPVQTIATPEPLVSIPVQEVVKPVEEPIINDVVQAPVQTNTKEQALANLQNEIAKTVQSVNPTPEVKEEVIDESALVLPDENEVVQESKPEVAYSNPFDETPVSTPSVNEELPSELIDTQETVIQKLTPADEIMLNTENAVDLNTVDAIETVGQNPFDMASPVIEQNNMVNENPFENTPTPEEKVAPAVVQETANEEIKIEPIQEQVAVNPTADVEVVPFEEPKIIEEPKKEEPKDEKYAALTSKVYDRDYSLGECFEKNFIFKGYENNKLSIISYAQSDDRKFLYKHFGLIRTFAQDVYGHEVELDFTKEEPRQA